MIKKLLILLSLSSTLLAQDSFANAIASHAKGNPVSLVTLAVSEARLNRFNDLQRITALEAKDNSNDKVLMDQFILYHKIQKAELESLQKHLYMSQKVAVASAAVIIVGMGYLACRKNV